MDLGVYTPSRSAPLGDHLGPNVQPAGAVEGQPPKRSLGVPCKWMKLRCGKEVDAPSHDAMNRSMRPRFEKCLETDEIPYKTIHQGRYIRGHKCICSGCGLVGSGRRILATEPVIRGVREVEVGSESTVGDLIVITGVTPAPDAAGGIGVPESTVLEIRCVCNKASQFGDTRAPC